MNLRVQPTPTAEEAVAILAAVQAALGAPAAPAPQPESRWRRMGMLEAVAAPPGPAHALQAWRAAV